MKKLLGLLLLSGLLASPAMAGKYGMSGCGLGSLIFESNEKGPQIVSSIVNHGTLGILGNLWRPLGVLGITGSIQTFAISTGTSNCDDAPATSSVQDVEKFVSQNRAAVETDIARGNGETIKHIAEIIGCQDSVLLGGKLQQNYGKIFQGAAAPATQVTQSIMGTVRATPELVKDCPNII